MLTEADRLRHSKFVGLREDKNPRDVVKEAEHHKDSRGETNMKLSGSDRKFLVEKRTDARIDTAWRLYKVEQWQTDALLRTFDARITQTQAARLTVREDVERWCELYADRLPNDGGTIDIDLNYVQKL